MVGLSGLRRHREGKRNPMKRGMFHPPAGVALDIEHEFANTSDPNWPLYAMAIQKRGRIPLMTLQPNPDLGHTLEGIRAINGPLLVRYAHEFNGTWYPWAGDPATLKRQWVQIAGALRDGMQLVWCPNVDYPGAHPLEDYYPGDEVVDIVGMDGYSGLPGVGNRLPDKLFADTYWRLKTLAPSKPIMICETGVPRDGMQAPWIRSLLRLSAAWKLSGVVYFNVDKERPWALGPQALRSFMRKQR